MPPRASLTLYDTLSIALAKLLCASYDDTANYSKAPQFAHTSTDLIDGERIRGSIENTRASPGPPSGSTLLIAVLTYPVKKAASVFDDRISTSRMKSDKPGTGVIQNKSRRH